MTLRTALVVCLLAAARTPSYATDVFSLFDGQCQRTTGLVLHVDARTIELVDLTGHVIRLERAAIRSAVLHQPLENPLAEIHVDAALLDRLREVSVPGTEGFIGWATSFYDDLLLFIDVEGKTHVLEPGDVGRVQPAILTTQVLRPHVYQTVTLAFPPEIVPCAHDPAQPGELPPTRVIADPIKLGDYFTKLEERYVELDEFEERTRVYAEPIVFDPHAQVGLIYFQDMAVPVPLYVRWEKGRAYRFQSETVLGNAIQPWLPFGAPSFSVRSDVKSHFFNATLIGNLLALAAGADAFSTVKPPLSAKGATQGQVDLSYNYLIMMGADYWRLSAAAGPAYLAAFIRTPNPDPAGIEFPVEHDVRADSPSLAMRVLYRMPGFSARALYFRTRVTNPGVPDDGQPAQHLHMDIVRLGATLRLAGDLELTVDEIVTRGTYSEEMISLPGGMTPAADVSFTHSETDASISTSFGRYVTVRGYAQLLLRRYSSSAATLVDSSRTEPHFGGALEFVF